MAAAAGCPSCSWPVHQASASPLHDAHSANLQGGGRVSRCPRAQQLGGSHAPSPHLPLLLGSDPHGASPGRTPCPDRMDNQEARGPGGPGGASSDPSPPARGGPSFLFCCLFLKGRAQQAHKTGNSVPAPAKPQPQPLPVHAPPIPPTRPAAPRAPAPALGHGHRPLTCPQGIRDPGHPPRGPELGTSGAGQVHGEG